MPGKLRRSLFQAYIRNLSSRIIQIAGTTTVILLLSSYFFTEFFGRYFDPKIGERFGLYYEWRLLLCSLLLWIVVALQVSDWVKKHINLFFSVLYVFGTFLTSYYLMPVVQPNTTLRYLIYIIPFFTITTPTSLSERIPITLGSLVALPGTYLALGWKPYFYAPLFLIFSGISFLSVIVGHYCFYRLNRNNFLQNRRLKQQSAALKRAKAEAEEANRKKNLFLANVTHDLRTPLNAIKGHSEILLQDADSSTRKRKLRSVVSAAKDLNGLINTLLDLSEIQLDESELERDRLTTNNLLRDLRNFYSQEIRDSDVALKLERDEKFPAEIVISETALKQIVFNLVDNAFKHTNEGFVRVKFGGEFQKPVKDTFNLVITVQDTGTGMDEDQLNQIFDLFNQGNGDDSVKREGFGLGLFICRELVNRMDGEITVSSVPGQGSTFTVRLPEITIADSPEDGEQSSKVPSYAGDDLRALILDDNEENRQILRNFLENRNIEVHDAENASELEDNEYTNPDVAFVDLDLPEENDAETMEILTETLPSEAVTYVAFTANTSSPAIQPQEYGNFSDVLRKPVQSEELDRILRDVTKTSNDGKNSSEDDPDIGKDLSDLPTNDFRDVKDATQAASKTGELETIQRLAETLTTLGRQKDLQRLIDYGNRLKAMAENRSFTDLNRLLNKLNDHFEDGSDPRNG